MSTAAYRNAATPSFTVPPSQNTALVLEFNCLYTHDVRRKQKRWQDGFLRFHTFNKRVMVFDVPRNFIGDTHWKSEEPLRDGDEVILETEGVIVQVTESVGRTETDISELRKSRKKQVPRDSDSSSPMNAPRTPAVSSYSHGVSHGTAPPRHLSLKAMLGRSNGPVGKARLPTQSPFDQRVAAVKNDRWTESRPSKKRRTQESPQFNDAFADCAINGAQRSETRPHPRISAPSNRKTAVQAKNGSNYPVPEEVVDLCSDISEQDSVPPPLSSGIIVPPLSPLPVRKLAPCAVPVLSSSPAFQRQSTPLGAERTSNEKRHRPPGHSLKETCTKAVAPLDPESHYGRAEINPTSERKRKITPRKVLRMAAGEPKKRTLLCQDQWAEGATTAGPLFPTNPAHPSAAQLQKDVQRSAPKKSSQQRQLQKRLAKIAKKDLAHSAGDQNPPEDAQRRETVLKARSPNHQLRRSLSESHKLSASGTNRAVGSTDADVLVTAQNGPSNVTRSFGQETPRDLPKSARPTPRTNRHIERTVSLNLAANGTSTVLLKGPFKPPPPPQIKTPVPERPPDPWSREAFDLFTWRPPGWDEEKWCLQPLSTDAIEA